MGFIDEPIQGRKVSTNQTGLKKKGHDAKGPPIALGAPDCLRGPQSRGPRGIFPSSLYGQSPLSLSAFCIACGMEDESAFHLLCDCPSLISLRMRTFSKPILGVEEYEASRASRYGNASFLKDTSTLQGHIIFFL
jgi:hypothetical protein